MIYKLTRLYVEKLMKLQDGHLFVPMDHDADMGGNTLWKCIPNASSNFKMEKCAIGECQGGSYVSFS